MVLLETVGRSSGRPVVAAVGYVERGPDRIDVAAGAPDADWARNLAAHGTCRVGRGGTVRAAEARELEGAERAAAIRDLILRYGTPAERLGAGPAFALLLGPVVDAAEGGSPGSGDG